jgi:hypothetical protein
VIRGYPGEPYVNLGAMLRLHVATDARHFSVRFLRWGARITESKAHPQECDGEHAAPGRAGIPWQWPEYEFFVPGSWRPGAYTAVFEGDGDLVPEFDARAARALFVVRAPNARAPLLVVLPLFTYQAYNVAHVDGTLGADEGESLYSGAPWVTLHRPGGGNGGHPWDEVNADVYDRASPRQTFVHWDGKGLAWLEREGFRFDCCTDVELHDGTIDLMRYQGLISFGHHEYWSDEMRRHVESYVARGGNVAFFGGNTCWFRIEYDAPLKAFRRIGRWAENPEWCFTGVSYAYGGGKWIGARPATGFTVLEPLHWLFARTGLTGGEIFGAQERLIGYECDAAPDESDFDVVASASIADWTVTDGSGDLSHTARADMGVREAGGTIFSASTVDWARVLESGEPHVEQITRNVLERFMA